MANKIVKNFSFVFGAQTLILIISVARALILPKYLSVEEFGYWEVYWFYSTYVGLFCLGYVDGIYLKYGEYDYDKLPVKLIRSGNRLFVGILLFFTLLTSLLAVFLVEDKNIRFGLIYASLNIVVLGTCSVFIYVYQITNLFKKYSLYSVLDKLILISVIFILLFVNKWNYKLLIGIDFFAKAFILLLMIRKTPDMLIGEVENIKTSFEYVISNVRVGIKLMIANIMSMLLIGAGKIIVQLLGDIKEFAIYSFGISITGLVLTMVVSVSLVLYPAVKRVQDDRYSELFELINSFNRLFGLSALLLYFPVYVFIELFYPNYHSVLVYLNMLFILIFLQCKISMLNNTFYKVLREERNLLYANMSCVLIFIIIALLFYSFCQSMWVIAACTCLALFYRCYSSELFLNKKLYISFSRSNFYEIAFMIVFLFSTALLELSYSVVLVVSVFLLWFFLEFKKNSDLCFKLFAMIKKG